jgi:hypothetical protein
MVEAVVNGQRADRGIPLGVLLPTLALLLRCLMIRWWFVLLIWKVCRHAKPFEI